MSVCYYAQPHLWADSDETLQDDPGGASDGHGGWMWSHPLGPQRGVGKNFKKAITEISGLELFCFICHRKDNNYAYTFAAGCVHCL